MEKSVLPVIAFRVGWFNFEYDGCITTRWGNNHDSKLICTILEHNRTNLSDLHDLQDLQHDFFFSLVHVSTLKKNPQTSLVLSMEARY